MSRLTERDHSLLLELLRLPTAGPLETGPDGEPPQLWAAQGRFAEAATELGFRVAHHAAAPPDHVDREDTPLPVRAAAAADPGFLGCQPSLVLVLGGDRPPAATVMFNVHLDTVAGREPVSFDGSRFHGRGAVDAKGPAVALLAGLRAALAARPELRADLRILIQAVSGEEGGALGSIGTRPLVEAGYYGRLNVFCEPTGNRALDRSTAATTARLRVVGRDAVDDRPQAGHNASVLLGFLAQHLAGALDPAPDQGQVCVAGLRTGPLHNKVYGTGELLVNLSYPSRAAGAELERRFTEAVESGLAEFSERFRDSHRLALTAADARAVTRLDWLKRGLPALDADPAPWGRSLLAQAGVPAWPTSEPGFTCDAIWLADLPGTSTFVLGPGTLDGNLAHAAGEFVDLADLEAFATLVPRLLAAFHARRPRGAAPAASPLPEPSARRRIPHAAAQPAAERTPPAGVLRRPDQV
ncbi:M20/M25/M40 family metallo-hydrolase [Streptacidiphilus sp. P02-A3a]|uniref:M20/M25/M40 family metallo-hydrolase n=1 Tax=Streptacidiphilus sp. P02-A3a TaxID=2704468 RepID=UPI0015FC937F|nr:M20/M25/M40 family metallo-hydrolase [Streptacidiphilus sp. P02-A3a]QMU71331.1 M20 family metallopeptidase [Streptacidiphilus sp. P02-A3a]